MSEVSFAVLKDREAYTSKKGFERQVHVRIYAGPKGSRRFAGELRLQPNEFAALVAGSASIEAVIL